MKYVLDASVAFKWVVPEPDSDKANLLRDDFRNGIHELLDPIYFLPKSCMRLPEPNARAGSRRARPQFCCRRSFYEDHLVKLRRLFFTAGRRASDAATIAAPATGISYASTTQHFFAPHTALTPAGAVCGAKKCGSHTPPTISCQDFGLEHASWRLPLVLGTTPTTFYPCQP